MKTRTSVMSRDSRLKKPKKIIFDCSQCRIFLVVQKTDSFFNEYTLNFTSHTVCVALQRQ